MNSKISYNNIPTIPVSWGELVDKITILEIKASKINEEMALIRINEELGFLSEVAQHHYLSKSMFKVNGLNNFMIEFGV